MDPSKRICLKNLPENTTKREIAEMIRSRTGAQPRSIDLGVDSEGNPRRFAHFSCEGAKNVLEALSAGCSLKGQPVNAMAAKAHYSYRIVQARKKREREEEEENKLKEKFWASLRQRLEAKGEVGELSATPKRLRSFYYAKQKYAAVASEIAAKSRAAFRATHPQRSFSKQLTKVSNNYTETSHSDAHTELAAANVKVGDNAPFLGKSVKARPPVPNSKKHRSTHKNTTVSAAEAPPSPPPTSVEVTKAERKLSGLQAKLALLKEKLKK